MLNFILTFSYLQLSQIQNLFQNQSKMGTITCGQEYIKNNQDLLSLFRAKNEFPPVSEGLYSQQHIEQIVDRIAPRQAIKKYKALAKFIAKSPKELFRDPNFTSLDLKQQNSEDSSSLKKLYNFSNIKSKVYEEKQTPFGAFSQRQLQLCYLNAIFYFIALNPELKKQICVTKQINEYSAFIVSLFCNGQQTSVIVDDLVPIDKRKHRLKYLNMIKPEQIWPFILQKAWCKQIGGYSKAKGLSPEDCFQQITGLPSQTFRISLYDNVSFLALMKEQRNRKYCVLLTAYDKDGDAIKCRQVFYLEGIKQDNSFILLSPYNEYDPKEYRRQLTFTQVYNQMQYVTIGIYEPTFVLDSIPVKSKCNEEKIYQIEILMKTLISIRLVQFYQNYLEDSNRQFYSYSPVLMELYDDKSVLIKKCWGESSSLLGLRSSKISDYIMQEFKPGKYYLRVQIGWKILNLEGIANVVLYGQDHSFKISESRQNSQKITGVFFSKTLDHYCLKSQLNKKQEIKIRVYEKQFGTLIGILNEGSQGEFKLIFRNRVNYKINHTQIHNNQLRIKLKNQQESILQILPEDPSKPYQVNSIDIVKL